MASETVRIGMIGAGNFTRVRLIPGFQAIDGVEIVAVCNRSEESGRRVADEFGIARVTTDPEELFASDDIDAIYIGTWPYRHREFSVRALEAGKHVLCEGRMAMDAAEAWEMLDAAQSRPGLVGAARPRAARRRCLAHDPAHVRRWRARRHPRGRHLGAERQRARRRPAELARAAPVLRDECDVHRRSRRNIASMDRPDRARDRRRDRVHRQSRGRSDRRAHRDRDSGQPSGCSRGWRAAGGRHTA